MNNSCRNVNDTLPIIQITQEIVDASRDLGAYNVGEWCFILNGRYMGFYAARKACQDRVNQLMTD